MAGENQVTTKAGAEENQVTTKENQVTTKNPKKVEAARRLAEYNHKKREELKVLAHKNGVNKYYDIGAVLAVGVIGGLGYYIYQAKANNIVPQQPHPQQPSTQTKKFANLSFSSDDTFPASFLNIFVDYPLGEIKVGDKLWTN